jgi:hypothetical protein
MLERDALELMCPFKFGAQMANYKCITTRCMAWEVWPENVPANYEVGTNKRLTPPTHEPKDPAEGDCGMKPVDALHGYPG